MKRPSGLRERHVAAGWIGDRCLLVSLEDVQERSVYKNAVHGLVLKGNVVEGVTILIPSTYTIVKERMAITW